MMTLHVELNVEDTTGKDDQRVAALLRVLADKVGNDFGIEGVNCMALVNVDGTPAGGVWLEGDKK